MKISRIQIFYVLIFLLLASKGYAQKAHHGIFKGQIPAYETMVNDQAITVAEAEVQITFDEKNMIYELGESKLTGPYETVKKKKKITEINAQVTNGRSIKFELTLIYDSSSDEIILISEGDRPETILTRTE